MAAGSTYTPISTTTVGTAASTITISSIPSTYTDLVLIVSGIMGSGTTNGVCIRVNGDTATNYSCNELDGDGSTIASYREVNATYMNIGIMSGANQSNSIFHFNSYSNTSIYKSVLSRGNDGPAYVRGAIGLWRSASAINSISIYNPSTTFSVGTTLSLYGITAA